MTVTVFFAQPYWLDRGAFRPGSIYQFAREAEALRRGERLGIKNAGVIIWEQDVEPDVGPVGEPREIARCGQLPRLHFAPRYLHTAEAA